jgi:hypothetical protein
MLCDDHYDEIKLKELADSIEIFLTEFKILYPDVSITYKMHMMPHYPRAIRMFGPPLSYSTMRFDSKHSFFKRVHNHNHNHVNLLSSLAKRHQELQLYHIITDDYFLDHEFGSEHKVNTQIKDLVSGELQTDNLQFFNYILYKRVTYTARDVVVIKRKTRQSLPLFAYINTIIYATDRKCFLLLIEHLITVEYKQNYTGYLVREQADSIQKIITIEELAHYAPINSYSVLYENNDEIIVVPKFSV